MDYSEIAYDVKTGVLCIWVFDGMVLTSCLNIMQPFLRQLWCILCLSFVKPCHLDLLALK